MFGDAFSITSSLPVFSAFLNSSILFSLYRYIPSYIISYIIPYTIPFIIPIIIFILSLYCYPYYSLQFLFDFISALNQTRANALSATRAVCLNSIYYNYILYLTNLYKFQNIFLFNLRHINFNQNS